MNDRDNQINDYRSLLLLEELSRNNEMTQRDLSKKLGIALGLINSYLKNLALKGYITISAIPRKRYKYYLTPKGFVEKSRMTYHHLQNFTNLYKVARQDFQKLFRDLRKDNVKKIVFCGSDEVAEIAYITLQEFGIKLAAVVDTGQSEGRSFFGLKVRPMSDLKIIGYDRILVASFLKEAELYYELLKAGAPSEKILLRSGLPAPKDGANNGKPPHQNLWCGGKPN
ncbi:MAG: winged helix-turn-helix transcriptional regulator [Deltaproteobacteria bacterium]|nr:winged helix-turn-helix transcriptional regulator [Deltaproteobacteria bacterium]